MFESTIRELRRLKSRGKLSVWIPSDAEGYLDRECPSSECQFQFKVYEDDWPDKVRDEEVFCPFCGHSADSGEWFTPQQIKRAKRVGVAHVRRRLGRAMKRDVERWNRVQRRGSFIGITMQVSSRPRHDLLPPAAVEPMRLRITCPECACRYAVIGAAFFCPACGHNAAELVFSQALKGIRDSLAALPAVRAAIVDRDIAETVVRGVIEHGLKDATMAFQRYAEALYANLPAVQQPPRRNAFQNLAEGSDLWHSATGKHYSDCLGTAKLTTLVCAFQRRHLLSHTDGIVDQNYIDRSGDKSYRIGQRLVIREASVHQCVDLIEELATGMVGDTQSAP